MLMLNDNDEMTFRICVGVSRTQILLVEKMLNAKSALQMQSFEIINDSQMHTMHFIGFRWRLNAKVFSKL